MRLFAPLAFSLALIAAPVLADSVTGEVLRYDPATDVLVLTDKSSWSLRDGGVAAPEGLAPGMVVEITFTTNGDNGFGRIDAIDVRQ